MSASLYLLSGIAALSTMPWVVHLLYRRPQDLRMWLFLAMLVLWAVSVWFAVSGGPATTVRAVGSFEDIGTRYLLRSVACLLLVLFFVLSVRPRRGVRYVSAWEVLVLVLVAGAMVLLLGVLPPGSGQAVLDGILTGPAPAGAHTDVGLFFLLGDFYLTYAYGMSLVWILRALRTAKRPLRTGLRVAAVSAATITAAGALLVLAGAWRVAGGSPPAALYTVSISMMMPGFSVFLLGMLHPSARTQFSVLLVWLEHRRAFLALGPLWRLVDAAFPEGHLRCGERSGLLDRWALRRVHERYYRRVIECRDGLVRLSPFLDAGPSGAQDGDALSPERLRVAIAASRRAAGAVRVPRLVAPPADTGLAADTARLIAVSSAVDRDAAPVPARVGRGVPTLTAG